MARKKGASNIGTFGQSISEDDQKKNFHNEIKQALSSVNELLEQAHEQGINVDIDAKSSWAQLMNTTAKGQPYPMPDGREVMFDLVVIKAADIRKQTRTHDENGREEAALTEDAVSDLIPSISKSGNFLPAVGIRGEDGVIELMDGLRRSWACYYAKRDFRVIVPREIITAEDAKYIADISVLSKALSYREQGKALIKLMTKHGFDKISELTQHLHGDKSTDGDAELIRLKVRAAEIDEEFLKEIPDYNSLSVSDYKILRRIYDKIEKEERSATDYIESIREILLNSKNTLKEKKISTKKIQKELIEQIKVNLDEFLNIKKKKDSSAVITELKSFDKNGYYARAKETQFKKSLEFGRIKVAEWERIKGFAAAVLNEDAETMQQILQEISLSDD